MPAKRPEEFSPIRSQIECPLCHERFDFVDDALRHMRAKLKILNAGVAEMRDAAGRRRIAECGTKSGYNAHLKRGDRPCLACTAAKTAYARTRYAADPTRGAERKRAWRNANLDAVNARRREIRALKKAEREATL